MNQNELPNVPMFECPGVFDFSTFDIQPKNYFSILAKQQKAQNEKIKQQQTETDADACGAGDGCGGSGVGEAGGAGGPTRVDDVEEVEEASCSHGLLPVETQTETPEGGEQLDGEEPVELKPDVSPSLGHDLF